MRRVSAPVFGGSVKKRNLGETSTACRVNRMAGSNSWPRLRAARKSVKYPATSSCATGRRKARGRKVLSISSAAASAETPLPGRATKILSRDLNSLAAASMANFAALIYFSARSGERNSVSPGIVEALAAGAIGG